MMDLGLRGRVAVVAASSKGIGKAVAIELAREGMRVAMCGRDGGTLAAAVEEVRGAGADDVVGVTCDLDTPEGAVALVEAATGRWGRLDVLVCNNGGPAPGGFAVHDDAAWEAGFRRLVLAFTRLVRAGLPWLERAAADGGTGERGGGGFGRVVVVTSTAVKEPIDDLILSNSLRGAISGAVKSLAREVGGKGITVNQVLPGRIATERLAMLDEAAARRRGVGVEEVQAAQAARIPVGRSGRAEEFAAVVAFLCSGRASFVNGASVVVDGGMTRSIL